MEINEHGVIVKDDLLNSDQLEALRHYFEKNVQWTFGSQSDRNSPQYGHWNYDFINALPHNQADYEDELRKNKKHTEIFNFWKVLQEQLLPDHELMRCYANAHTYGVEGYPHIDSRIAGNYSTVIYLNPTWMREWAGETVVFNEFDDIVYSVMPKPGRIICFDGRHTHVARSVSRRCPALRTCLVIKTKKHGKHDDSVPKNFKEYLLHNQTKDVYHGDKSSLYDHLVGTYNILCATNAPSEVSIAGLFHSIYGTNIFRHVSVTNRDEVKNLVGEKAERLVWLFSVLPRPFIFEENIANGIINDSPIVAAAKELGSEINHIDIENLVFIECA